MSRDWDALRQRLARALDTMERTGTMTPEQATAIMDARAAALAGATSSGAPRQMIEILTFGLAGERYAIETRYVQTVTRVTEYATLPQAPAHFFGLIAVRGELAAIVDLRRLLHVGEPGLNDLSRLIVLGTEQTEFAILADVVHEVTTMAVDELRPPPDFATGVGRDYLRGITEAALIVLDGQALLDDRALYLDDQAEA